MNNKTKIVFIFFSFLVVALFCSCDLNSLKDPVITGASYESSNSFRLWVDGNKDDLDVMRYIDVRHVDGTSYTVSSCHNFIVVGDYQCKIKGTFKPGVIEVRASGGKLSGSATFTVPKN